MASLNLALESGQRLLRIVGDICWGWQNHGFRGRGSMDYVNDTQIKVNLDVLPPTRQARLFTTWPTNVEPQRHGDESRFYSLNGSRLELRVDLVKHQTTLAR